MGRKRTSKKERVNVSVDIHIIDKLRELNVNRSVLFTDAALEYLEKMEKKEKDDEN